MRTLAAAVAVAVALGGCDDRGKEVPAPDGPPDDGSGKYAPRSPAGGRTAAPFDSSSGGVRVSQSADGSIRVEGAPELRGDPEACKAFRACCVGTTGPTGLACALAPAASGGDCREALIAIRSVLTDQKLPYPPGCDAPPAAASASPRAGASSDRL